MCWAAFGRFLFHKLVWSPCYRIPNTDKSIKMGSPGHSDWLAEIRFGADQDDQRISFCRDIVKTNKEFQHFDHSKSWRGESQDKDSVDIILTSVGGNRKCVNKRWPGKGIREKTCSGLVWVTQKTGGFHGSIYVHMSNKVKNT
jgi:hypothetical protein